MAVALCSFIPFPLNVEIYPNKDGVFPIPNISCGHFIRVLKACQSFSNLQQPINVTVRGAERFLDYY